MGQKSFLDKLHMVDARKLTSIVPEESVDVIITSPPYADLKDYGFHEQIGFGQSYDEYIKDLKKVFEGCYKATKKSGSFWLIVDTFKRRGEVQLLPFDLANVANEAKWKLHDIIIWDKTKTLPWSRKGQLRNIFEYILFFTKSRSFKYEIDRIRDPVELKEWWIKYPERYNPRGKVPTNIWKSKIPTQGSWGNGTFDEYFCPFPPELIERILQLTTNKGSAVMDPFAGSGSVLAQAKCMGRHYVGFELNKTYIEMFHNRVIADIAKSHKQRQKILEKQKQAQESLRQTIPKLRLVRFSKILVRRLIQTQGEDIPPINTIFVWGEKLTNKTSSRNHKWLKAIVFIVLDKEYLEIFPKDLIPRLIFQPPLSKFGLVPEVEIMDHNRLIDQWYQTPMAREAQLWVYKKGLVHLPGTLFEFNEWRKSCLTLDWVSLSKNGIPPIVANVSIPDLRTVMQGFH